MKNKTNIDAMKTVTPYILIAAFAIVTGPLIRLWALNTLTGLNIEYTFINWLTIGLLCR